MINKNNIPLDWQVLLDDFLNSPEFEKIISFLDDTQNKQIFPASDFIFNALKLTAPHEVKVVILGQDPYHDVGQAHGLSFSVPKGIKIPPSLRNIFKELCRSYNVDAPESGDLSHWAEQGVLLLNTCLTVEAHKANSHSKIGWQEFTDFVIQRLSENYSELVFILWGAQAHKKEILIKGEHLILKSVHPSPLSAHRGFLGCNHFVECNEYLKKKNKASINWI